MSSVDKYKTVKFESFNEFVEKRSKFIGYVKPTKTELEAEQFINKIKSVHKQATHNVYAYVIRHDCRSRFSDDGEPHGTAGVQVLEVLKKQEIFDATVVVTRYFGGVLLGTGGLVRAYSKAASLAVESGKVIVMTRYMNASVTCDYTSYNKILPLIYNCGGVVDDTSFDDKVKINFHIVNDCINELEEKISEVTSGKVSVKLDNESFYEKNF